MKMFAVMFLISAALVASAAVLAHHSQAMYTGPEGAISITGVVKKFDYTNPHAVIYLEVTDSGGKKKLWVCEMQSIRALKMLGWLDSTVKFGDSLTIIGRPARDGAPAMYSEAVKLPDGRMMRS
jgi:hypothetical protein